MGNYNYAFDKYEQNSMARAVGISLTISTKNSVEICNALRRTYISKAYKVLDDLIALKTAVKFRRFNLNVGHRRGKIGPGRFPINAATEIKKIIRNAETNAQQKGLNSDELFITHICAHMASRPMRYGRQSGQQTKRTHVEVVLTEMPKKKDDVKKRVKKSTSKKVNSKPNNQKTKEVKV